jgi:hypothetical protein
MPGQTEQNMYIALLETHASIPALCLVERQQHLHRHVTMPPSSSRSHVRRKGGHRATRRRHTTVVALSCGGCLALWNAVRSRARRNGGGAGGSQIRRLLHHGSGIWARRGGTEGVEGHGTDGPDGGQIHNGGACGFPAAARSVMEMVPASPMPLRWLGEVGMGEREESQEIRIKGWVNWQGLERR